MCAWCLQRAGAPLPLLPITSKEEKQLFSRLYSSSIGTNFNQMALEWCKHVDGKTVSRAASLSGLV